MDSDGATFLTSKGATFLTSKLFEVKFLASQASTVLVFKVLFDPLPTIWGPAWSFFVTSDVAEAGAAAAAATAAASVAAEAGGVGAAEAAAIAAAADGGNGAVGN